MDDLITIGPDWKKKKIQFYTPYNRYFKSTDTNRLKAKEWKNIRHVNCNHKRSRISTPTLDKMDLRPKNILKAEIFCNDERVSSSKWYNNEHLTVESQNTWTKPDRIEGRNREFHDSS